MKASTPQSPSCCTANASPKPDKPVSLLQTFSKKWRRADKPVLTAILIVLASLFGALSPFCTCLIRTHWRKP